MSSAVIRSVVTAMTGRRCDGGVLVEPRHRRVQRGLLARGPIEMDPVEVASR